MTLTDHLKCACFSLSDSFCFGDIGLVVIEILDTVGLGDEDEGGFRLSYTFCLGKIGKIDFPNNSIVRNIFLR